MRRLALIIVSLVVVALGSVVLVANGGAAPDRPDEFGLRAVVAAPGAATSVADHPDRRAFDPAVALADGTAAPQEYYAANLATVECLRAAGATVTDPQLSPNGRLLNFSYSVPTKRESSIQAAYADCHLRYADAVVVAWIRQTSLTPSARAALAAERETCVKNAADGSDDRATVAVEPSATTAACTAQDDLLVFSKE